MIIDGTKLRNIRVDKKIPLSIVAAYADLTTRRILQYEDGQCEVNKNIAMAIAESLGVDITAIKLSA